MLIRSFSIVLLLAVSTGGCSTTAERQVRSGAYESCKALSGDARDRCIKGETERLRIDQNARNEACLDEIAQQQDRSAMIKGARTGDPNTSAAGGGCDGPAASTGYNGITIGN